MACDLRIATPQASFGIPAGRLGLAVDGWTVERLSLIAGAGLARAMLLAAEVVKGDEAHRLGFVQRLGGLDDALAWADEVAALAPLTLRAHKAALRAGRTPAAFTRAWESDDSARALAAFHDRRRPVPRPWTTSVGWRGQKLAGRRRENSSKKKNSSTRNSGRLRA